jgi:hypothetical protein
LYYVPHTSAFIPIYNGLTWALMSFGPYLVTSTVGSGGYDVYVGVPFGKASTTAGNPTAGMGIEMVAWSGSTPPTT